MYYITKIYEDKNCTSITTKNMNHDNLPTMTVFVHCIMAWKLINDETIKYACEKK